MAKKKKAKAARFVGAVPPGLAVTGVMAGRDEPAMSKEDWEASGRPCWMVAHELEHPDGRYVVYQSTNVPLCVPLLCPVELPDNCETVAVGSPSLVGDQWWEGACEVCDDVRMNAETRTRKYGSGHRRAVMHGVVDPTAVQEFSPAGTDPAYFELRKAV